MGKKPLKDFFYIQRAAELKQFSPIFNNFSRRKKLKPWEKGLITREFNKYQLLLQKFEGDLNQLTIIPQYIATRLKKSGRRDELLYGLNVLALNQRGGGKTVINKNGDITSFYQRADRENVGEKIRQGRRHTFVFVRLNYSEADFSETDDFADYVIKRFRQEHTKRKIPPHVDYRIWIDGALVERGGYVAGDWELFLELVRKFLENYQGHIADRLKGFSYYNRKKAKGHAKRNRKKKKA